MQAPVTQSTGPDRIRQPAWYFRRERGMNCSRMVRVRLGKTPTDPCGVPSGLVSPKPTIPGGPADRSWTCQSVRAPANQSAGRSPHPDSARAARDSRPGASRRSHPRRNRRCRAEARNAGPREGRAGVSRESDLAMHCPRPRSEARPDANSGSSSSTEASRSTSGQAL